MNTGRYRSRYPTKEAAPSYVGLLLEVTDDLGLVVPSTPEPLAPMRESGTPTNQETTPS